MFSQKTKSLQMTLKFVEATGNLIKILEEHTLIQEFKLSLMIGETWPSQFSKIIGIFAVSIQIQNTEELFMELTCQVHTLLKVSLTTFPKINGSLRQHLIKFNLILKNDEPDGLFININI
jgi:hypothetical protein